MTRLELVIAVSDVLLNVYGTRNTRKTALNKKFGAENAAKIQKEVDKCLSDSAEAKYLAIACIADHYGKDPERSRKLGRWAGKVQVKINAIYGMRGKSMDGVVKDVINNNYDKDDVRELLLKFCGYNPDAVQKAVNDKLTPKPTQQVRNSLSMLFISLKRMNLCMVIAQQFISMLLMDQLLNVY